ncbi:hypothetical protein PIB30_000821 [Stylosanthes scabra]|uniref:Uncharacterized protein n=1 Tax=Stylosanthes scabra TaxID=79078 RepID=A0ABU6Q2D5_9FABA|nr:hypothetical protein [Stylosanthes scabra]
MGNCQAIDTATLVIQQPNGKVEKLYWPVSASEVMKSNPGHYVALLISSTTLCSSKDNNNNQNVPNTNNNNQPVRLTRIKLLKPTDTLVLGQVYRLISAQEVMKGLWAKKQAKMKKNLLSESDQVMKLKPGFDMDKAPPARRLVEQEDKQESNKGERHGSRTTTSSSSNGGSSSGTITAKSSSSSRTWQPSLQSISEATT